MTRRLHRLPARRGAVLILVLWLLVTLGVIGLTYSSVVRNQMRAGVMTRGRTEAYWAARAGVEKARAILLTTDLDELADGDLLLNDPETFAAQKVGNATFSLVDPSTIEPGQAEIPPDASAEAIPAEGVYGLIDEGGRINVNRADSDVLLALPTMTGTMADSLMDWVDTDDLELPDGAELAYYEEQDPPVLPSNAPLTSIRELVRIKGWREIFDAAWPDPWARYLPQDSRPTASEVTPEDARLLLDCLTVWSVDECLAPDGQKKMGLSSTSADQMRQRVQGLSDKEAKAIEAHRKGKEFKTAADLLDVEEVAEEDGQQQAQTQRDPSGNQGNRTGGRNRGGQSQNRGQQAQGQTQGQSGNQQPKTTGQKIFKLERVGEIIDYFAVQVPEKDEPGRVNINTASRGVLMAIPGMSESFADAIIQQREADGAYSKAGAIANLNGIDSESFREIYPWIMTRSSRFRVISQGRAGDSRAGVSIEAVLAVDADAGAVQIIYWRESTLP